jgi:hypothetical protein
VFSQEAKFEVPTAQLYYEHLQLLVAVQFRPRIKPVEGGEELFFTLQLSRNDQACFVK